MAKYSFGEELNNKPMLSSRPLQRLETLNDEDERTSETMILVEKKSSDH